MIGLVLLAFALATDAFAVALVRGASGGHDFARALETGLAFGAAQGLMPLAGWALGTVFLTRLAAIDHWIAFGLLAVLGVRMLREGLDADAEASAAEPRSGRSHYAGLALAAVATSIDAAAAGLTLDLFGLPIVFACAIIALVTAGLCIPAYWFAARAGDRIGGRAEVVGGLVLIALGCAIVIEHTGGL